MGKQDGIRVYLRLRPPATAQHSRILGASSSGKRALDASSCNYYVENDFDGSTVHFHAEKKTEGDFVNNTSEDYAFAFRRVFEPNVGQEDVFNVVAKDCVTSALSGYNSTIFAYGQTGSGKTYSITGGTESYNDRGIIPRALGMIYEEVAKRNECAWNVSIAYLQIYNDKGQDLLNHGKDAKTLEELPTVTVHDVDDDTTVLRNLEQHVAPTLTDALNLLFLGDTNRLYCETPMNRTSSRSHCVFTVHLEARVLGSSVVRRSKLNLVDLAGSERVSKSGVDGTILSEAKYINLSLHYLEHVIVALSEQAKGKRDHVPYRNSFMTMVLRDSLGGNCRTSMLATAHLAKAMLPETISTCSFAQRVACIRQHARVNEEVDPLVLVAQLKMEVAQLKDQLAFYQAQHEGDTNPDRELTEEEKLLCRGLVDTYLYKTDPPQTRLEGFQGDLARIYYCFAVMKDLALGSGGSRGNSKALVGAPTSSSSATAAAAITQGGGSPPGASPSSSSQDAMREGYEAQIAQLQVSLQQRENEVNTMFELVSRAQGGARFNAATQTPSVFSPDTNSPGETPAAGSPLALVNRGAAAGALARVTALTESGKLSAAEASAAAEYLRRKETLAAGDEHVGAAVSTADGSAANRTGYNLAALSDAELVEDRAAAFESFKQSYKNHAKVEATKAELKDKYDQCKETAAQLNNTVDTIKAIKTQVQRLRAERAVDGVEEADPQETALLAQLTQQRETYNELAAALRSQKETIDGMHAFMKRSQEQLTRDFEAWLATRKKQLALAVKGDSASPTSRPPPSAAGRAPAVASVSAPAVLSPSDASSCSAPRGSLGSAPVLTNSGGSGSDNGVGGAAAATLGSSLPRAVAPSWSQPQRAGSSGGGSSSLERHPSSAPSPAAVAARLDASAPLQQQQEGNPMSLLPLKQPDGGGGGGWMGNSTTPLPSKPLAYRSPASSGAVLFPSSSAAATTSGSSSARNHHLQPISSNPSSVSSPALPPPGAVGEGQASPVYESPVSREGAAVAGVSKGVSFPMASFASSSGFASPLMPSSSSLLSGSRAVVAADTEPRNPFAPEHRSTGNKAADEQLAALYKLRDSMRAQRQ